MTSSSNIDSPLGIENEERPLPGALLTSNIVRRNKRACQYIYDRANGESRSFRENHPVRDESRPPIFCCFVPPCVKLCPGLLEQNWFCVALGRVGLVKEEDQKIRILLMRIGLCFNLVGLALTIVACMAISTDFDMLQRLGFSHGKVTGEGIQKVTLDIGTRAVAIDNPNTFGKQVVSFNDFCDYAFEGLDKYMDPEDCQDCKDVSSSLVITLVMSTVTFLPSIFTNVLRMYVNYDVNCQKVFGTLVTFFSMVLSCYTWIGYQKSCFGSFYGGDVSFDQDNRVVDPEDPGTFVVVDFDWAPGVGLKCIVIATFLKAIDIACHLLLPTPSITRDEEKQYAYESARECG